MRRPYALSSPFKDLCDDAAATLEFEHSEGTLLGISLRTSDSGFADTCASTRLLTSRMQVALFEKLD